jgi:hypothetical protein
MMDFMMCCWLWVLDGPASYNSKAHYVLHQVPGAVPATGCFAGASFVGSAQTKPHHKIHHKIERRWRFQNCMETVIWDTNVHNPGPGRPNPGPGRPSQQGFSFLYIIFAALECLHISK